MSFGYKLLIAGALGLAMLITLGLGAFYGAIYSPHQREYQTTTINGGQIYPPSSPRNGLAEISGIHSVVESAIAEPQPRNSEERNDRDLAAQEAMATFTYWMFLAVVLQTLLAGGALLALLKDLSQNRRSGEAQLRAYVTIEPGGINEPENGQIRLPYVIKNAGQTPAYDLAVFGDVMVVTGDPRQFNPLEHGRLGKAEASTDITLGPGGTQWNFAYQLNDVFEPFMEEISAKTSAIVHYGFLQYQDAFGAARKTNFAFYHWGEELSDAESKRCRFGNSAT